MATVPHSDEHRSAGRKAMFMRVAVLEDGFPFATARIRNVSALGLGGIASDILVADSRLAIALPGVGEVEGRVKWSRGVRFGFVFDTPIDIAALKLADIASTKLPSRYTDKKRYRTTRTSAYRPGFYKI